MIAELFLYKLYLYFCCEKCQMCYLLTVIVGFVKHSLV